MEFPFYVTKTLIPDKDGFVVLNAKALYSKTGPRQVSSVTDPNLVQILDRMGEASSRAQGLRSIITTYSKFMGSDHRLYLKVDSKSVLGLIKVGEKNLFYHDNIGSVRELHPVCVLDFYVHESVQRMGVGKELFEKMLEGENIAPSQLAYDRPSPKLIGFLKKHYGLANYISQNNNFVIFNQYFDKRSGSNQLGMNKAIMDYGLNQQGAKDKFSISKETTNPLLGGSLKKPAPLGNQANTLNEFYNVGRQILNSNYSTSNLNNGMSAGSSPTKPELRGLIQNQNIESFSQASKQLPTNNLMSNGTQWSKNSTERQAKTLLMEPNNETKKVVGRDQGSLFDVQDKLKRTEEDILKCKERIDELTRQKNNVGSEYSGDAGFQMEAIGRVRFQQRLQDAGNRQTPWATHHHIPVSTSSASYGNHFQYQSKRYY